MRRYVEGRVNKRIHSTPINIKDDLEGIDLDLVCDTIESLISQDFLANIDGILIGKFPELDAKQVTAAYADGAIYISSSHTSEEGIIEDIIHEIAHSIEETHGSSIYSDSKLVSEFLSKRKYIYFYLNHEGMTPPDDFLVEPDYSLEIDKFLHDVVGYEALESLSTSVFLNPYSMTSVREYWAVGFSNYVYGNQKTIKNMCPALYSKLEEIVK